ncbi:MAG: NAD(P)-dependent oxidoreductase [Planctomycetes bacterium]|nr:NAD(P)-dependent oxidoreductase [Planctomycetota bacterium]
MGASLTVLITGGAGYIGSLLTGWLLERGHRVRSIDALLFGGESIVPFLSHGKYQFVKGDAYEVSRYAECFEGVDAVAHLAALVGFPACQAVGPEVAWRYNFETTQRVFRKAQESGARRFVFASTYSNYGVAGEGKPVTEESPLKPQSLYAETKVKCEEFLLSESARSACVPVLFRFATLYGVSPRTRFDLIVNQFVLEALTRRKLIIYQRGYSRSFVHVADVVRAIELAITRPDGEVFRGQVFNVGSDEGNFTKTELVELIAEVIPKVEVEYKDLSFGGDMRDIRVSFEKIQRVLGFQTTRTVRQGIREVADAIENGIITEPSSAKYRNAQFIVH